MHTFVVCEQCDLYAHLQIWESCMVCLYLQLYEQYDEEEIGALDHEDIGGCLPENSKVLNNLLDEFEEQQTQK